MTHTPVRRGRRPAVAAVEFAVVLPVILTLLLGIWEVGRLIEIQQLLTNAAREGGRQASTGQLSTAQVKQVVTQYLQEAGLNTTNVVVTIQDLDTTSAGPDTANYLDRLQISVSIPVSDVRWSVISLVMQPTALISSQVEWTSMVDKPYPSSPVPPQG